MRAAQIKAELRERRIDFADCFDKESLADKLGQARAGLISPLPTRSPSAPTPASAPAPTPAASGVAASSPSPDGEIEPARMRAAQIKAELRERRIDFADCFDKESLADKLGQARAGLISPPTVPPPPGAAKGEFEFGVETRQGEDEKSMLEDAFKAAGWTGQGPGDPSKVDTARSPGMSRNFADVDVSDFRKPYSRGS